MKFNITYKPTISFKETVKAIANIKEVISQHMLKKYSLVNVTPPALSDEEDNINIDYELKTRNVTFESSENRILKLFLSHSNWTREILQRLNLKNNQGIYFAATTIWRDLKETAISTITNYELTFAFCIPSSNLEQKVAELTFEVYNLIYKLSEKIQKTHKIEPIFPKHPNFISTQQLENEMPNLTFFERENEMVIEENAFFLTKAGTILFSGKKHSLIPVQLYDLEHFNQIVMFERNNSAALKVASIGVLASGKQLSRQLSLYGHSEMASLPLYQKIISDSRKFMEIKINLPRLAMVLLAKGHISEVQAEITSNEAEFIKSHYGIETY